MTSSEQSNSRGWVVTCAALGINLLAGIIYAWSVIGQELAKSWHWTKMQAAFPFAIATASFAIMMIFAGRVQDKIGPRKIAVLGGIFLGAGYMLCSLVHATTPPFYMAIGMGVVGLGLGLGYSATTPASIKWFSPARKGFITGIVVSGVGLAAVYASFVANYLLATRGIEQTFLIIGIACMVLVCLLSILLINPPVGYVPKAVALKSSRPAASAALSGHNLDWHEILKTPQFYLLWLMFVLAASPGLMMISNMKTVALEQATYKNAVVAVMFLAIFNTAGRFVSGFVSDRIGRRATMMLFFAIQAANMFAFSHYTTPAMILTGASITGLCYGTIFTLFPAATADLYGVKNLGVNYGFVFTAFGVGGVLGSLLGGRVRDLFGTYDKAYAAVGIMLLVAIVLAILTRPRKALPQKVQPQIPQETASK